jgi:hypothetical protein
MKTRLLVAGVAALTLGGGDAASAYLSGNTIDGHSVGHRRHQRRGNRGLDRADDACIRETASTRTAL